MGHRFFLVWAGLAWAVGWKPMASRWSVKRWKYFFSLNVCQMIVFFGFWVMDKCLNIWKKFFATSNITYYFLGVREKSKLSKPSKPSKPYALTWYMCNKLPNSPSWNSHRSSKAYHNSEKVNQLEKEIMDMKKQTIFWVKSKPNFLFSEN